MSVILQAWKSECLAFNKNKWVTVDEGLSVNDFYRESGGSWGLLENLKMWGEEKIVSGDTGVQKSRKSGGWWAQKKKKRSIPFTYFSIELPLLPSPFQKHYLQDDLNMERIVGWPAYSFQCTSMWEFTLKYHNTNTFNAFT